MKKKLLVIRSGVNLLETNNKALPSIISAQTILKHFIKEFLKLRPLRIGLLGETLIESEVKKSWKKWLQPLPASAKLNSLDRLVRSLRPGKQEADLVLVSSDFFLKDAEFLKNVLSVHQKSANDLTLIAGKTKSASDSQLEDYFVYPGLAIIRVGGSYGWIKGTRPFNPSGQLEVVSLVEAAWAASKGIGFHWVTEVEKEAFIPVNSLEDFSKVVAFLRQIKISQLESQGVFFLDPSSAWVDTEVKIGPGTVIYPSVFIEGNSRIGKDCLLYPHCHIINSRVGDRVKILGATIIEGTQIEPEVQVGPFSRLRPETRLKRGSQVGNFVEMKKTVFGQGSKAMHLSYLGDARIGEKVNIGAGTITCNYDGEKKNKTYIEKEVFIGSGTELVAPVRIGRGSYVAAGSTITDDVSPEALAIARARQLEKPGWAKERRARISKSRKKARNQKKGK
ncbi:MAG: DapH/DapD/GlmU-related protein [Acidobacteriota bacterium]|nr:DapH/DapD/GlmU-related protein [Acidobacteriota bacterium]MDW3229730.1 DapH/DapD/GlmU-related protein [Acidobacteriota bacterium]